jgi:enolase
MYRAASSIANITARQIFDSRGRPTVEADVTLADGTVGRACVPSGTSTGRHEAWELRDGDKTAFGGLGVTLAASNARNQIAAALIGQDALDQGSVDRVMTELDGTPALQRLGANAVLAVSLATARAAAAHLRLPLYRHLANLAGNGAPCLPMPMANVLSGAAQAGRGLDFQDFLAIPVGAATTAQAVTMIWQVSQAAARVMKESNIPAVIANDGGLGPDLRRPEQALEVMVRAIEAAGLRPGADVAIGLDLAASDLRDGDHYHLASAGERLSSAEMIAMVADLARRFPVISVEDPLDQDDWAGWRDATGVLSGMQVVGDDLFATNPARIARAITDKTANAAILKLNQNGTLSGTLAALAALRAAGYGAIVAARSGDTEDTFVADLAVGTGAGQIKIGAFRNTERTAKYNQLLRIEEETGLPLTRWRSP